MIFTDSFPLKHLTYFMDTSHSLLTIALSSQRSHTLGGSLQSSCSLWRTGQLGLLNRHRSRSLLLLHLVPAASRVPPVAHQHRNVYGSVTFYFPFFHMKTLLSTKIWNSLPQVFQTRVYKFSTAWENMTLLIIKIFYC